MQSPTYNVKCFLSLDFWTNWQGKLEKIIAAFEIFYFIFFAYSDYFG